MRRAPALIWGLAGLLAIYLAAPFAAGLAHLGSADWAGADVAGLARATAVSVGPDNITHLLWSNTDRRAMFWDVGADLSFTLAGYGPYTDDAPGNLWSVTAVSAGP